MINEQLSHFTRDLWGQGGKAKESRPLDARLGGIAAL